MKTLRNLVLLLLWGGSSATAVGTDDALVVRSLRYALDGNIGKLMIGTNGIPVVATARTAGGVTLAFRHATVSSPPGAAHVSFKEGPIRSAVIERSGPDSITVSVRLRSEGTIDVGLEGHDVVLRVMPRGAAGIGTRRVTTPVSTKIAAMENGKTDNAPSQAIRAHRDNPQAGSLHDLDLISALGLLSFAALTSIAFAAAVVRRRDRKTVPVPVKTEVPPVETASEDPGREPVAVASPEIVEADEEETEDEVEARAYQLAKALRRGKGEMELALRMESKQGDVLGEKIAKSCRTAKTKAQRVNNAKRLGVGRGEIDLALRLKTMVPVSNAVEEP